MMQDIAASLLMEFEKSVLQVESAGTILKTPLDSQASRIFCKTARIVRTGMADPDNSRSSKKTKKNDKEKSEYELCKVCNLNHDQGPRHKYFPSHKKSLSSFLSRFLNKLTDIRFFLKNPTALRPEHASRNRLWCVFCDTDVDELGSSFACSNAIAHLASEGHLKNLKHFMWKHGGGMDRVDTFRILEADAAKWEKKCQSLNKELASSTKGAHAPTGGPPNDIQNEYNYGNIHTFEKCDIHPLRSKISNGVMPLQYYTNEYQVSNSGLSAVANVGYGVTSLPAAACSDTNSLNTNYLAGNNNEQPPLSSGKCSTDGYLSKGGLCQDGRMVNGESSYEGLQKLTQVSSIAQGDSAGNVHSGAPPPWLEALKDKQLDIQLKPVKSGKSHKLNPKRVGAAWAERRKLELEMEKRGEIVKSNSNADWLPNFGRVWQSGSRKQSRKEFEVEKQKLVKTESQSDVPIKIQPYISKRMRGDAS